MKFRPIKNTFVIAPLFSLVQNVQQPDYSVPPKSAWQARLREHKGGPGSIIMSSRDENLELAYLLGVSGL